MSIVLAIIGAGVISGAIGFFGASWKFYASYKKAAADMAHSQFLVREEVANTTKALECSDGFEKQAMAARDAAQESAALAEKTLTDLKKLVDERAQEFVREASAEASFAALQAKEEAVLTRKALDGIKDLASEKAKEIIDEVSIEARKSAAAAKNEASKAAKKAKQAADQAKKAAISNVKDLIEEAASEMSKQLNAMIRAAKKEEREKWIRKRPEPCQECDGLGYRKSKNNRRYDCKFCDNTGIVERYIKPNINTKKSTRR